MAKTLWILSEERPKMSTIEFILEKFSADQHISSAIHDLQVVPIPDTNGHFSFWYQILGFQSPNVQSVMLGIVSGTSSFVDFLVFFQEETPAEGDRPLFMIEETKTGDNESRNTGVFQRSSKFVYADLHYPQMDLNMFYNLQVPQAHSQSMTNIFGNRCLASLGVKIAGKNLDEDLNLPFDTLEEMMQFRAAMRRPPRGNVAINLTVIGSKLHISGRLFKDGGLKHDPNIGALSLIAATARKLGWSKEIVITEHGLAQSHVQATNKFVRIASALELQLQGLTMPSSRLETPYWRYNTVGEKLATIFVHLIVERFGNGQSVFENHAGSEKGYFVASDGQHFPLEKYVPGVSPRKSLDIPDLILRDDRRKQMHIIEGKTLGNMHLGIQTLKNYDDIEQLYVEKHYPDYLVTRSVVLYGGHSTSVTNQEVSFLLNADGVINLGGAAPALVKDAITGLREYWAKSKSIFLRGQMLQQGFPTSKLLIE